MQDTHIRPNELSWNQYWDKYYRELNKELWNHYGSGKVRRIKAGVKHIRNDYDRGLVTHGFNGTTVLVENLNKPNIAIGYIALGNKS